MPHEELVTKISTLRAHVQSLRENSESDEPMLDTIYDTLKELEWSLFLEFHQSEKCLEQLYTSLKMAQMGTITSKLVKLLGTTDTN